MLIKTTGIEQYLPGGSGNLKVMVIGGPGVGKTRWSSFWPEPFYLNCEDGLSSVADRKVPYVDIEADPFDVRRGKPAKHALASEKMLNALRWLKSHPDAEAYGTVIVDTLDAYQRKLKQEWLDLNPDAPAFTGYDAWGYIDGKIQALMTRLLSLDKNVLVLVHYKDKEVETKDDAGNKASERVFSLQLQGDIKDTSFNDFDLVGWMDTFWKPGESGRVEARGLTFQKTPQRWMLKDRLHIAPKWLEVNFDESDYTNLFSLYMERVDELTEGQELGEVALMPEETPISGGDVVQPLKGGPVEPQDPRDMPLDQLKKNELLEYAKANFPDADVKTSMLKAEIIEAIEAERAKAGPGEAAAAESDASSASDQEPEVSDSTDVQAEEVAEEPEQEAPEPEPTVQAAEEVIKEELGGEVISETKAPDEEEKPAERQSASSDNPLAAHDCETCGKNLAGENPDYVKLGYIKFRKYLCNDDYKAAKKG